MNPSRLILVNVLVLVVLVGGAFAAVYYYNQSVNYIATDNAQVDGQLITVISPTTGKLTAWSGAVGNKFNSGQTIGTIQSAGVPQVAATPTSINVTIPAAGTIVQQSAVTNSFVATGTTLARAYAMDKLWISANINETQMNNLKQNQTVDVYLDAFPGTTLTGKVSQIGLVTAAQFSLLPQQNTTANYTKVTQVIPVVITLDGYQGVNLVPGMSASVRIHLREQ